MKTWQVMETFYHQGKCRAIGVSNFEPHHLEHLLRHSAIKPMVNQIEVHPRRPCVEIRKICSELGIAVTAYGSLGCGDLLSNPVVLEATKQCTEKSAAQVLLRWGILQGLAVIPKSTKPERIASYSEDLLLSGWSAEEDAEIIRLLSTLADGHKYCWDSSQII
jgi:diketogulonate reductase-like aldo/keto reductase